MRTRSIVFKEIPRVNSISLWRLLLPVICMQLGKRFSTCTVNTFLEPVKPEMGIVEIFSPLKCKASYLDFPAQCAFGYFISDNWVFRVVVNSHTRNILVCTEGVKKDMFHSYWRSMSILWEEPTGQLNSRNGEDVSKAKGEKKKEYILSCESNHHFSCNTNGYKLSFSPSHPTVLVLFEEAT